MSGLSIYLINFIQLGIVCLVFISIGRQFAKRSEITFRELFFSLFIGTLLLSTCFALVKTGGKTVMLGFLLLACFSVLERRNYPVHMARPATSSRRLAIGGLLFGSLFVFSWSFFTLIQFDGFPYHIPAGSAMAPNDYLINVLRSHYLGVSGEENYYHFYNELDAAYHGPKPYHYLEMWTTVSLNSIFGGLTAEKFVLMVTPLYHFIAFTGIMALWERYQSVKWYHFLLSASFLFLAGVHFSVFNQFGVLDFSLPIFTHRVKMCVYYPFILGCLLMFDQEKPQFSMILLSGLVLATVVVAPAVMGGAFLYLGVQFFRAKYKRNVLESAGILISMVFFVFVFYKFLETGQFNIRANAGSGSLTSGVLSKLMEHPFHIALLLVQHLLRELVSYLPLLLLGLFLLWKEKGLFTRNLSLFILVSSIMVSGAGAYALFEGEKDATQLFFNMGNALMNCCLIWAVIRCLSFENDGNQKVRAWYYLGVGLLLIPIFLKQVPHAIKKNITPVSQKHYSDDYLMKIKAFVLADEGLTVGAAIKGGQDYRSAFSKQTAAYTLGYYLAYMENGALALQVSDFDIPNVTEKDRAARASNLFYRFVEQQRADGAFVSIGASQVAFIRQYELDFVVVSRNGLVREEVLGLVEEVIEDSVSGERFLIVK